MHLIHLFQLSLLSTLSPVICDCFVPTTSQKIKLPTEVKGEESKYKIIISRRSFSPRKSAKVLYYAPIRGGGGGGRGLDEEGNRVNNDKSALKASIDDEEPIDVDIVRDRAGDSAAKSAKVMSSFAMSQNERFQLGKSYSLSSLLWSSIILDILTNRRKRCLLLPGVEQVGGQITKANLGMTISLAMGYILAAGASYFLSIEFKKEDKGLSSASMSSYDIENSQDMITSDEDVRKKTHLFLFLFGITNLGAHFNTSSAPFLGLSGFVINVHNSLNAFNAWKKDTIVEGQSIKGELQLIANSFLKPYRSLRGTSGSEAMGSWIPLAIFYTVSRLAVLSGLNVILTELSPYYLSGVAKVTGVDQMRRIGIQWAKLARVFLCTGSCLIMKDKLSESNFMKWGYKNQVAAAIVLFASLGLFVK